MKSARVIASTKICVHIALKILRYFVKKRNETLRHSDYLYFDIELISREKNLYYIRVTNFHHDDVNSQNRDFVFREIASFCFVEVLNSVEFKSYLKTIAFVVKEEKDDREQIYELQWFSDEYKTSDVVMKRRSENFASHKKYLSLRLECKVSSKNIEFFKNAMIDRLAKFAVPEINAKCVFRSNIEKFWTNDIVEKKLIGNCRLSAAMLAEMIKNSRNESFRKKCLGLIGANDASNAEEALTKKIVSLIGKNYPQKRSNRINNCESRGKRTRKN